MPNRLRCKNRRKKIHQNVLPHIKTNYGTYLFGTFKFFVVPLRDHIHEWITCKEDEEKRTNRKTYSFDIGLVLEHTNCNEIFSLYFFPSPSLHPLLLCTKGISNLIIFCWTKQVSVLIFIFYHYIKICIVFIVLIFVYHLELPQKPLFCWVFVTVENHSENRLYCSVQTGYKNFEAINNTKKNRIPSWHRHFFVYCRRSIFIFCCVHCSVVHQEFISLS